MADRPYVVLSCAMSLDGYIDDASGQRLVLSNEADLDLIDDLRAGVDAILIGAGTVRRDDPRLEVRSARRRDARVSAGQPPTPIKVVLSGAGELDPSARLFAGNTAQTVVYGSPVTASALGRVATVVPMAAPIDLDIVLSDVWRRGVRRLLVEGGSRIHTQFLERGLADELRLVVAPFFIGDHRAPRFVGDGRFPYTDARRMRLARTETVGDCAVLTLMAPEGSR